MKKNVLFVFGLFIIIVLSSCTPLGKGTGYTEQQLVSMPVLSGWNFVSFSRTISKIDATIPSSTKIFKFQNNKWEKFDGTDFEANVAYFMNFQPVATLTAQTIKIPQPTQQQTLITLTQGWNSIGFSKDVIISDLRFKGNAIGNAFIIYTYNSANKQWEKIDTNNQKYKLLPNVGYLVKTQENGILDIEITILCTESNWILTLSPTACPTTGQQTKTWTKTGTCTEGVTHPATETVTCIQSCTDAVKNQDETDVDCGGVCVQQGKKCADAKLCSADADCQSNLCTGGKCVLQPCYGQADGTKCPTGVCRKRTMFAPCAQMQDVQTKCPPPIEIYECIGCIADSDCPSAQKCINSQCSQVVSNSNGIRDGTETDIDCGGTSGIKCTDNKICINMDDCQSGICLNRICQVPTCTDNIQNGLETGVDCGGSCSTACFIGDDFEDGDYTKNPEWKTTPLIGDQQKEIRQGWLYGRNVEYATPSTQAFGTWNFKYIFLAGKERSPRVYFIASHQDMINSIQKTGYYLSYGSHSKIQSPFINPSIIKVVDNHEEKISLIRVGDTNLQDDEQPFLNLELGMSSLGGTVFIKPVKILLDNNGKLTVETPEGKFEGNDNNPIKTSNYFVVTGIPFSLQDKQLLGTTTAPFYIDNIQLTPATS